MSQELQGGEPRQHREQLRAARQQAGIAGTLYYGARLVIDGDLTVGELVAFNMLAGRVSAPVLRLAQMWQDFHQARLSVARLGDILNTAAEPAYNPARAALPAIRGDVTFEHVIFRYRIDAAEVLHDVNLAVPAGQMVGIVGSSGEQSTLAKLFSVSMSRKWAGDGGRRRSRDGGISWLQRQIGVVLQENVLFNRSVRQHRSSMPILEPHRRRRSRARKISSGLPGPRT
jgi:subfamily B ATP-binding cassette protein HlyB/CyaB